MNNGPHYPDFRTTVDSMAQLSVADEANYISSFLIYFQLINQFKNLMAALHSVLKARHG
jgi:hypothetical protein